MDGPPGPGTDVYMLAEVAFLLLCGAFPFGNHRGIAGLLDRKGADPPSARECRRDLPRRAANTLRRAMAVRPADRHESAGRFADELASALGAGRPRWWRPWR